MEHVSFSSFGDQQAEEIDVISPNPFVPWFLQGACVILSSSRNSHQFWKNSWLGVQEETSSQQVELASMPISLSGSGLNGILAWIAVVECISHWL